MRHLGDSLSESPSLETDRRLYRVGQRSGCRSWESRETWDTYFISQGGHLLSRRVSVRRVEYGVKSL